MESPKVLVVGDNPADLRMRGMHGLALLTRIKGHDPSTETVIIKARADTGSAIEALNLGAFGYLWNRRMNLSAAWRP